MFTEATVETSVKGPVYKSEVLKVQFEIVKIGLQKVKVVLIASVYYRWKKCSFDTAVAYNAGLVRAVACIRGSQSILSATPLNPTNKILNSIFN